MLYHNTVRHGYPGIAHKQYTLTILSIKVKELRSNKNNVGRFLAYNSEPANIIIIYAVRNKRCLASWLLYC